MAIQYVGGQTAGRAGATGTTAVTFALSGGLAAVPVAGDLVVCTLIVDSLSARHPSMAVSGYTIAGSAGTADGTQSYSANLSVYYKRMGSTPDTTITLPSTGNIQDAQRWAIQVFRGVDATTPIGETANASWGGTGGANIPDAPSVTISGQWQGCVVLACGGAGVPTGSAYTTNGGLGFLSGSTSDTADAVVAMSYAFAQGATNDPAVFAAGPADMSLGAWVARTIILRPARLRTFHVS